MITYILALVCGFVILGLDQLTKYYISTDMVLGESREFINGLIDIIYIHNRGGAWGMLSDHTWILTVVTIVVMGICVVFLVKYGAKNKLLFWGINLVMFGGIGNLIDRIFKGGNVIDFLHFEFWPDFPIFNIADCVIVIGAGMLILHYAIETVKEFKNPKNNTSQENDASI